MRGNAGAGIVTRDCGRYTSGTIPRGCLPVWCHGLNASCSGCKRRRIRELPTRRASGCIP